MAILDFLIGRKNLDKIQNQSDQFARAAYDPSQVDPMVDSAQNLATKGIDTRSITENIMGQIYRQTPNQVTGVSQGTQLSAMNAMDANRAEAVAGANAEIGIADEEAKLQGSMQLGEAKTQRNQLRQKREAAVAEGRMLVEAEAGRRRSQILSGAINLASASINPDGGMLSFLSNFNQNNKTIGSVPNLNEPTGISGLTNFLNQ